MKEFIFDILGCKYTVVVGTREELKNILLDPTHQGEAQLYKKKIAVCTEFEDDEIISDMERERMIQTVLRHEVAHAFLFESGRTDDAVNEDLVNWLEIMAVKLVESQNKVFDIFKNR